VTVTAGVAVTVTVGVAVTVTVGVAVTVAVTVTVGVAVTVWVTVTVGVGVGAQSALLTTLVSRVTAPFRASSRPLTFAPVVAVMEVRARMLPLNVDPVPRVAELPTCQKTLQA
jgi:hypothetical protein